MNPRELLFVDVWMRLGELGRSIFDSSAKLFKPSSKDYADETDQKIDEWSQVGVEARGDQRRDHESDGLTNFMSESEGSRNQAKPGSRLRRIRSLPFQLRR